jgi:hypothetical protein
MKNATGAASFSPVPEEAVVFPGFESKLAAVSIDFLIRFAPNGTGGGDPIHFNEVGASIQRKAGRTDYPVCYQIP